MGKALQPVSVDGIEFDALMEESRTFEADAPEYPVESGFVISDSLILRPLKLDMTLYVTNTPVTWQGRFGNDLNRVETVVKALEELYFNRKLITVSTTDKTYENMAIMSLNIVKNLETGYAREIPISFKQLRITEAETVTIPASYGKSGATGENAGTANTTKTDVASGDAGGSATSGQSGSKGSILYSAANAIGIL